MEDMPAVSSSLEKIPPEPSLLVSLWARDDSSSGQTLKTGKRCNMRASCALSHQLPDPERHHRLDEGVGENPLFATGLQGVGLAVGSVASPCVGVALVPGVAVTSNFAVSVIEDLK